MTAPRPPWPLALGLFWFAPFVGEFVLGNTPVTAAPWALMLAPMYGGGAVLIREVGRRTGGWPTMFLLAAAYALLEEGPIDQMLFNPDYLGLDSFEGWAPIPGLDISAALTASSLAMHAIWSICVPIAVVEAFDRRPAEPPRPWLGWLGIGVTAVVFVLGSIGLALLQWDSLRFVGTALQFTVTSVVILGLVVAGLWAGRTRSLPRERPTAGVAPSPRRCGLVAFALTGLYWLIDIALPWFAGAWTVIVFKAILAVCCGALLLTWSRRAGWGRHHRLAVAGGALCTYIWVGFVHAASTGFGVVLTVVGGVMSGSIAVLVLRSAIRTDRKAGKEASAAGA